MLFNKKDTICAPATPLTESAIGIVRISGDNALKIGLSVFKPTTSLKPEVVIRGIIDTGHIKDKAIMVFFKSPKSYTGEDVVELYIHGSPLLMRSIINTLVRNGARPAEPGEFTKRAFINGKIDLTQAESVAKIIQAKSEKALKIAVRVLQGELKKKVEHLRSLIIDAMVLVEGAIEFSEDVDWNPKTALKTLVELKRIMKTMLEDYDRIRKVFEGYRVVIIGKPNVGKSTLFNKLLGYERAIVTPRPGTTRDYIESTMFINRSEIKLFDTAGLRRTEEEAEEKGVTLSKQLASKADLILLLMDGSNPPSEEDKRLLQEHDGEKTILILNKKDVGIHNGWTQLKKTFVKISALKGDGIEELKNIIRQKTEEETGESILIDERHKYLLENSMKEIEWAIKEMKNEKLDLAAERLRDAEKFLKEITGDITCEEVLNEIFSRFCIGK